MQQEISNYPNLTIIEASVEDLIVNDMPSEEKIKKNNIPSRFILTGEADDETWLKKLTDEEIAYETMYSKQPNDSVANNNSQSRLAKDNLGDNEPSYRPTVAGVQTSCGAIIPTGHVVITTGTFKTLYLLLLT